MSRGQKKFACQNEALISSWAGVPGTWVVPMGNLLLLIWACSRQASVPLRKPGGTLCGGEMSRRFWRREFFRPLDNQEGYPFLKRVISERSEEDR
ncbi:MAG: hypothetical protein AMJ94_06910 [Deltaproteobacteria bacterium SM23_61]|nr:MAG: hypothetical protein AMJ94_06910 [Deltaproteobacteria bacterium SM23_61]